MSPAEMIAWVMKAGLFASTHTSMIPGPAIPLPPPYAAAIAAESVASPLFAGADGDKQTAALLVSLSWFEGGNNPAAIGDCKIPDPDTTHWHPCIEARIPQSFCALQIHIPGGKTAEGWTRDDLLTDPTKCIRAGLRILKTSITGDRSGSCPLCLYARGRDTAEARALSGHRMGLAHRIFAEVTP